MIKALLIEFVADVLAGCAAALARATRRNSELRRHQVLAVLSDGMSRDENWICDYLARFTGGSPNDFCSALHELEDIGAVVRIGPSTFRLSLMHKTTQ